MAKKKQRMEEKQEREEKKKDREKKKKEQGKERAGTKKGAEKRKAAPIIEESESELEDDDDATLADDDAKMVAVWKSVSPPVAEGDVAGKWFAVVYRGNKSKSSLYIGKVLKRFLTDVDGPTSALEIECLRPMVGKYCLSVAISGRLRNTRKLRNFSGV